MGRHPDSEDFLNASGLKLNVESKCASRKDTPNTSYSISYSQASASNGNQGYILRKILVFTFYYAIITLPIPYYKTYVIHGIIAHKQTNLIYDKNMISKDVCMFSCKNPQKNRKVQ